MESQRTALIIFARKPERGKVKTRLAAAIGDDAALRIYIRLLTHTREVARQCDCDLHVFLTGASGDPFWAVFSQHEQSAGDLGAKMEDAFDCLFTAGYRRVVIIGSDCPELGAAHVREAFSLLKNVDVVIGPAADGGYYLLGMSRLHKELFRNKRWSTEHVFGETVAGLRSSGLTYRELPVLRDVDDATDLPEGWL